jgi:hypothetical protein
LDSIDKQQPQLRDLAACIFCARYFFIPALQSKGAGNAGRSMRPQPRMQNKISMQA